VNDLIVILDFLSRAIALVLAIGGFIGFIFRKAVSTWIDTRFKAKADAALEGYKGQLAESLEAKKAVLARELEEKKAQLATDLERDKQLSSEAIRRKAHQFDKNTSFYETFDTEFGTVISELYALHSDYITTKEHDPLVIAWRQMWLDRAHKMLTQAHEKLRSQEQYIDSSLKLRVAHLFADLSTFMAGGARDKKRLDELALEVGHITAQLVEFLNAHS